MVAAARRSVIGVWAVPSWRQIAEITHDGGVVFALAFSPTGQQIAAASNGQVQVWKIDGPTPTARFAVPAAQYFESMPLAFDRGGRFIAFASGSGGAVWDLLRAPVERLTFRHEARIRELAFSPDGTHVAAGGGAAASVYSVLAGREVGRMTQTGRRSWDSASFATVERSSPLATTARRTSGKPKVFPAAPSFRWTAGCREPRLQIVVKRSSRAIATTGWCESSIYAPDEPLAALMTRPSTSVTSCSSCSALRRAW